MTLRVGGSGLMALGWLALTACSSRSDVAADRIGMAGAAVAGEQNATVGMDICTAGRDFAIAACERAARCGIRDYADLSLCADYKAAAMLPVLLDATPSDMRACAAEARSAACDAEPVCGREGRSARARREQGGACGDSDDCRVGLSCQDGRCGAVVENVTPCTLSGHCETLRFDTLALSNLSPLRCDSTSNTCKRVTATGTQGQPCSDMQRCGAGLYCKRGAGAAPSACAPVQAYGDACTILEDGCPACHGGKCTDPLAALCR